MAITKLKSFGGEAEVLGRLVEFEYEQVAGGEPYLLIHGLTVDEAELALTALGVGKVVGVRPPVGALTGAPVVNNLVAGSTEKPTKPEPPPPPKGKEKPTELDKVKVKAEGEKPPEQPKPVAETKPAAGETKPPAGETKSPPAETKTPPAETKTAENAAPANGAATNGAAPAAADDDPDAVFMKATKMRDILYALEDRGIKDEAKMTAECERLKGKVPLLAKMPNIADRVKRTLEVMHGGVAAA